MELQVISPTELRVGRKIYRCAVGKNGFSHTKQEGDNCTPIGIFALRECWWRSDRLPDEPVTGLPVREIQPDDGWCDAPTDHRYNTHITLPFTGSHEKLWREDGVYDIVVPLGYNDNPVVPGKGSAIFMHVARPGYEGTEGCVALALADLLEVLRKVDAATTIRIEPQA